MVAAFWHGLLFRWLFDLWQGNRLESGCALSVYRVALDCLLFRVGIVRVALVVLGRLYVDWVG